MAADAFFTFLRNTHAAAWTATLISVAYFFAASRPQALSRRLLASAHGVWIAASYGLAWLLYANRLASDRWAALYLGLMALGLAGMVVSLLVFRGDRRVHLLLLLELPCLAWLSLRGAVVISGLVF